MIYDLSKDYPRKQAIARFKKLLDDKAVVEVTEKRMRTPSQNRYLHLLIGVLAMETGNTLEYAKKWYFKIMANRDLFVFKKEDRFAGHISTIRSSRDLTKEEMSLAIDRFKNWAREQGIYLPEADDTKTLQEIEVEMARCQNYL